MDPHVVANICYYHWEAKKLFHEMVIRLQATLPLTMGTIWPNVKNQTWLFFIKAMSLAPGNLWRY